MKEWQEILQGSLRPPDALKDHESAPSLVKNPHAYLPELDNTLLEILKYIRFSLNQQYICPYGSHFSTFWMALTKQYIVSSVTKDKCAKRRVHI